MITLITGAPGSGKTLYCIDKLMRPVIGTSVSGVDEDGRASVFERRIFSNINGLLLDHVMIDAQWLETVADHRETGSFIVFDEVQRVWPNRPPGSKKPVAVEYLETHRHDGIDFVLMTQSPQLLDPAVRALVGRHLHMRRLGSFGAAVVYEWDACSNSLNFKNAFSKTPYKYSKKVFELYTSSRAHTSQNRKLPFAFWMFLGGIAASAYFLPQVYGRITGQESAAVQALPENVIERHAPKVADEQLAVVDEAAYRAQWKPRMDGLPHTAPRYDQLTQPSAAPVPAACLRMASMGCQCFTQQATPIDLPEIVCERIVAGGLFVDFAPDGAGAGGGGGDEQALMQGASFANLSVAKQRGPQSGE